MLAVIAKLRKTEIRLHPFTEPSNSGGALAPPAPPLNTALWQGVKLSRLNSIFTSIVVLKFLIKIQLTKSNAKIKRGINPPCPMPIRVNVDSLALSGAPTFLMHFYPKIRKKSDMNVHPQLLLRKFLIGR